MTKRSAVIFAIVFSFFLAVRFAVLPQMYHQDEYKWAVIADSSFGMNLESDHPPLIALSYRLAGFIFGFDFLRLLPFLFSILNLFLVFKITEKLYSRRAAFLACAVLAISVYSIIASTQIDIDGALLPFTFLLSVWAYIHLDKERLFAMGERKWLALLFLAFIFGFSVKLSFVLAAGTIVTDYLIHHRFRLKEIAKSACFVLASALIAGGLIFFLDKIFGVQNSGRFLSNAEKFGFLNFGSRNYFQVLFLSVKSIVLASPILVIPIIFAALKFEYIKKFRMWFIFVAYNLLFYLVLFDFSNRTIERYMMFLIIPATIVSVALVVEILGEKLSVFFRKYVYIFTASLIILASAGYFIWVADFPALPLNPKSAYIDKISHLNFNFLIPITGGSGPIGFYLPVSFVILFFSLAFIAIFFVRFSKKQNWQRTGAVLFLGIGLIYNVFLASELIGGVFYGSVDKIAKSVINEAVNNINIAKVVTYYDYGGYELNQSGKYLRRFYTDPMYAESTKKKFAVSKDIYAVIDFPKIDKASFHWDFLKGCKKIYSVTDKKVDGYIFDCAK